MPNFRRSYVPGGTFFFTLVSDGRRPIFDNDTARTLLHDAIGRCRIRWPFELLAIVLLREHLHAMWTVPPRDDDYSRRWAWIKKEFTKGWLASGGAECAVSLGRMRDGRRGVWQPKFWEHTIRDERDFERHFDYVHFNPVKHGYARRPADYAYSSFHRCVRQNIYDRDWGSNADDPSFQFHDLNCTAME